MTFSKVFQVKGDILRQYKQNGRQGKTPHLTQTKTDTERQSRDLRQRLKTNQKTKPKI